MSTIDYDTIYGAYDVLDDISKSFDDLEDHLDANFIFADGRTLGYWIGLVNAARMSISSVRSTLSKQSAQMKQLEDDIVHGHLK